MIDAKGKTIIPGFVDMHAHHHRESGGITPTHNFESAVYLAYGVTTTLDPSTWEEEVFPLAEMIEAGRAIGPRTFSTGMPLLNGSGPFWNELTSYEVTEHEINRLASYGVILLFTEHYTYNVAAGAGWKPAVQRRSAPFNAIRCHTAASSSRSRSAGASHSQRPSAPRAGIGSRSGRALSKTQPQRPGP